MYQETGCTFAPLYTCILIIFLYYACLLYSLLLTNRVRFKFHIFYTYPTIKQHITFCTLYVLDIWDGVRSINTSCCLPRQTGRERGTTSLSVRHTVCPPSASSLDTWDPSATLMLACLVFLLFLHLFSLLKRNSVQVLRYQHHINCFCVESFDVDNDLFYLVVGCCYHRL